MRPLALFALLASNITVAAVPALRAPCDSPPVPAYAPAGSAPAVVAHFPKDGTARVIAPCAADLADGFDAVVALSGSFSFKGEAGELLERLGGISKLQGLRYWSTTDKSWNEFITKSHALGKAEKGYRPRGDFSAAEMSAGNELFYAQSDNRSKREVTYRMRTTVRGPDQIVVQAQNITGFKSLLATVAPGDLRTVQFLRRRGKDTWDYYLVSAVRKSVIGTNEASLTNRANALYRYVTGQRIDAEPPLAP
jgi:hypothetical protein